MSNQAEQSTTSHARMEARLTVAALVQWQGRFLAVEEETDLTAMPTAWLDTYLYKPADSEATYVRTAIIFDLEKAPGQHHPENPNGDVLACHWLTLEEIAECKPALRSPLAWQCIEDYLAGTRLPLSALKAFI